MFCLHHEPSAITAFAHELRKRGEVDDAIARDGEHSASDACVEAQVSLANFVHHPSPNVFQMDMHDAVSKAIYEPLVVEPAAFRMSRVEKQTGFAAS